MVGDWLCNKMLLFLYLGFLMQTFSNHRTAGEGGGCFFTSSLLLPCASQTLRYQLTDYCRELTSAYSQWPNLNWEPLVSKCKWLTINLCIFECYLCIFSFLGTFFKQMFVVIPFVSLFTIISQIFKLIKFELSY